MNKQFAKAKIIKPENSSENQVEIHRAGWIVVTPWQIIENGYVKIENNLIVDVGQNKAFNVSSSQSCSIDIDHGPGVLMSPLVNAHTHLELSCFKDKLDMKNGFETWVKNLIELRQSADEKSVKEHAEKSIYELYNSGVLYVGDISTSGITRPMVKQSLLKGVWFKEFLGSRDDNRESLDFDTSNNLHCSYAGHAPHTTSPALLMSKKKQTNQRNLPFSIHVSESDAEVQFIETCRGKWAEFLKSRNIDFSLWNLGQKTPVEHLWSIGLLDSLTLIVHLLNLGIDDLEIVVKSGAKVCICPRSNMNLHGKLPRLEKMLKNGIKPCLGTDSLASCGTLSIFDEMRFVANNFNNIQPSDLLAMATLYGADALGAGKFTGTLEKGKMADMLYISLKADTESILLEKITGYE